MLILDNIDNFYLNISSYFPVDSREIILIITRNLEYKIYSTVGSYELGIIITDETATLLFKTAGIDNTDNQLTRTAAEPVVLILIRLVLAII